MYLGLTIVGIRGFVQVPAHPNTYGQQAIVTILTVESGLYYLEPQLGGQSQTLHRLGVIVTTTTLLS